MPERCFFVKSKKGSNTVKFYEYILYWVSVARGYICRTSNNLQAHSYQCAASSDAQGCSTAVKEVAGKERQIELRYRILKIAFILIIALMILLMIIAQPLRVYALGYASETILELILSTLAGTAAYAFLAAGGAELIVALLVGMGVSLTVSMIAQAINVAVENGAWTDFVNNCQGHLDTRKATGGELMIAMGAIPFMNAYNWVKEHILGIKPSSDDESSNSLPDGEYVTSIHINSKSEPHFSYDYEYQGQNYNFSDNLFLANGCFRPGVFITMSPANNSHLSAIFDFQGEWSYNGSSYDSDYKLYLPKFTVNGDIVSITNELYVTRFGKVHSQGIKRPTNYTLKYKIANDKYAKFNIMYHSDTKQVSWSMPTTRYLNLTLSDGTVKDTFNSLNEFIYLYLFNSIKVNDSGNLYPSISGVIDPVDYSEYYDTTKDLIKTTADSLSKKVAAGDITDETEGTIAVNVGSIPNVNSEVNGSTSISSTVAVTNVTSSVAGVNTMTMSNATVIGSNSLKSSFSSIGDKLPFSAMKSISSFFNNTFNSKYPDSDVPIPVIPVKLDLPFLNKEFSFDIDFSPIKPYVGLIRASIGVEFIIAMYLFYKKWLINKSSDG